MAVMATLTVAAYPYFLQQLKLRTAEKISAEALEVLEAADIYYGMNCNSASVPVPTVVTLKSVGLLKATRDISNPWGGGYVVTFMSPKTLRTQIIVTADFGTAQLASFVKSTSRESRVNGTLVEWVRVPTIINDTVTLESADDLELFSSRPCFNF